MSAGLAIYDTMRLIPNDVSTLALGLAASMGQFLLSAGTLGKRYALPHARILMHQGSAGIGGTAVDIEIQAENLERVKEVVLSLIAEHGAAARDRRAGLAARPLVHRGAGTGVRLRRPGADRRQRGDAGPAHRDLWGAGMSQYTIPSVVEKTVRGERAVDIYSRLLTDRIVYVGTEIDDGVANVVIAQLLHLESESPDTPINLYLNSPGGSVTAMLAIYDTMQFVRSPIGTTCVGQAASSAAVLLASGTPGSRMVLPHARVVLHQPSGAARAPCPTWRCRPEIARIRVEMERILSRHTGRSVEQVREDTDRDLVMSATDAVAYGIVDGILDSRKLGVGSTFGHRERSRRPDHHCPPRRARRAGDAAAEPRR